MLSRRKTTICREAWYYLAVLGVVVTGAMLREINLLFVLAGMIAGPLLLSWRWVGASLKDLKVERRLPRGVHAGDPLVVGVALTNARRRVGSWAVVAEEHLHRPGGAPLRPMVYFPYVPAGQTREATYRGRLPRRGRYVLGPIRVSTRFPFGLFRRAIVLGGSDAFVVYPRLGRLAPGWIAQHQESFEGAERRRQRFSRVEGEFYGVREWRAGDTRRSIHWRSSARRGGLVVRRFDQPHSQDVAVVVDLWAPRRPETEDLDRIELAVSFAATIVTDLCRGSGGNVLLGTTATPSVCTNGPASAPLMREALEQLALAEPTVEDGLPALLGEVLNQIEPGAHIILITTRSIDLGDANRFGSLWRHPSHASILRRIRPIETSAAELGKYFHPE